MEDRRGACGLGEQVVGKCSRFLLRSSWQPPLLLSGDSCSGWGLEASEARGPGS